MSRRPKNTSITYSLDAELQIRVGDELLANAKRIALLRQIQALENLTKAAALAGYSYKGAWDAIDQMAMVSGGELIERFAGGKGGGRTKLTERGHQLLQNVTLVQDEHRRFIDRLNALANGLAGDYASRADTAMKTSVRNQFAGIIVSIAKGPANAEIGVMVNGMQIITASITHESCRELKLQVGSKVFALIKASSVLLSSRAPAASRNSFTASVQGLTHGDQRSEVVVGVADDLSLVSTMANADIERLGLVVGKSVTASFAPSSVIIGVAA
ncbi:MAG: TOBE domain-containing protein [Oxalobacteraceae bacterium]